VKRFWEKFWAWRGASLARRIVVSVAGFSLLTCLAIGAMSLVAVSIARAVLPADEAALAQASASADALSAPPGSEKTESGKAGRVEPGKAPASRTDATRRGPRATKTQKSLPSDATTKDEEDE
jgi:hypothetical protein